MEPSVKRARRYDAGTNSRKDDANADSHEYDADTDALIRIHAPIKSESKYHLAPLMNKALLSHCRRASPPLQARPSLLACTAAIWTRGVAPPQVAPIAFANGLNEYNFYVCHSCPRNRGVGHASRHLNTRSGVSAIWSHRFDFCP